MRFFVLYLTLLSFGLVLPSFAAEKEKAAGKSTPITEWIAAENKLIDTLDYQGKQSFYVLRNKHGVIRSVRYVHRDVGKAVKACGKENADLKKPMTARFKQWESAVIPVLDLAEKFLKEEIETQQVVHASDFRHVMKLNDKAFKHGDEQIEKQIVTSNEACENLLESMDRTEDKMVELLQDMLLPESVIRERAQRAKEAAEAAEKQKKSE